VNEGANFTPRGQISPLGDKFTPRGEIRPWGPVVKLRMALWNLSSRIENLFEKLPFRIMCLIDLIDLILRNCK
jgi:hypothetical protein